MVRVDVDWGVNYGTAEAFRRFGDTVRYLPIDVFGRTVGWVVAARDEDNRVILTLELRGDECPCNTYGTDTSNCVCSPV